MIRNFKWLIGVALLMGTMAQAVAADFALADLEAMVKELDSVLPRDPKLDYPIKCSLVTDKRVNAYAWQEDQGKDKKPRAVMVVYTGFVDYVKGNKDIIRACVSHEVSHLSRGHVSGYAFVAKDLNNLLTRQQEYEADVSGASALQRLGYSKQAMIDMFKAFEKLDGRKGNWWDRLTADHADSKARIVEIAGNETIMESLVTFDIGLAFCDSRRWFQAGRFFDEAAVKEPKLLEAYVNSAQCSLMYYYDLLPASVRDGWLRVDFGPVLKEPEPISRPVVLAEEDRVRWRNAMAKIATAIAKAPNSDRPKELQAICQVLEPDADRATVQKGIDSLKSMLSSSSDELLKLRYANNAAVGMDRINDLNTGYKTLIDTQKKTTYYNWALGENLGRITVKSRPKEDEALAADIMYTWLTRSSSVAPYWTVVEKAYKDSMAKLGIAPRQIDPLPLQYCRAASLWKGGRELSLFRPVKEFEDFLGAPEKRIVFEEKYPDMMEIRWAGATTTILTEKGKVMRVTTYEPGCYVFLQPSEKSVSGGFRVTVGMSVDDLKKIIDPDAGTKKKLARGGQVEEWTYFDESGMGIVITDGRVSGITVTPVEWEKE